jgi:aminoglycoside phosphotransferase (APT) family kinase protein
MMVDTALAQRLVSTQFPEHAHLKVTPLASSATDNVVYRLGEKLVARLPRSSAAERQIEKDVRWLPAMQRQLSTQVPSILGVGMPDASFPYKWTIQQWIDGVDATPKATADWTQTARSLARVVTELRQIDATSGPAPDAGNSLRGAPLTQLDEHVRHAAAFTQEMGAKSRFTSGVDVAHVLDIWDQALTAPAWAGPPVWVHGDLTPGNVLVRDNDLAAVIDFGCSGVGDPACDNIPAWTLFTGASRADYLRLTYLDDHTHLRARGWAVYVGITAMPYHYESNPAFCRFARGVLDEVVREG